MYTITFYSFKGGVGRTMALLNIGAELAQRGRRVLLVDFDLEAPGIDTFDATKSSSLTPGLVDYVTQYVQTGEAPDVTDYVYSCKSPGTGALWVMPAGRRDAGYSGRLAAIDWAALYSKRSGFLFMEDLKEQWRTAFAPDYVLIDSRTGHTDIGGICTRQLPDAVVVMFFPNDQNLAGLPKIVRDAREHAAGERTVALHFAPSNVPDLDDEDQILSVRLRSFKETLGYSKPAATIHHYGSLALLNQELFTITKPRTRLAREYRQLLRMLIRENVADREGALEYLQELRTGWRGRRADTEEIDKRLVNLELAHAADPEVLTSLALVRFEQGDLGKTEELLTHAISHGTSGSIAYGLRATTYGLLGDNERASDDAQKVLDVTDGTMADVRMAVGVLKRNRPEALAQLADSPALRGLVPHEQCHVVDDLLTASSLRYAQALVEGLLERGIELAVEKRSELMPLVLALIGLGRFAEAKRLIGDPRSDLASGTRSEYFNFAMAEWGTSRSVPVDLLRTVVDRETSKPETDPDANYALCLAIAAWAVDDRAAASQWVGRAQKWAARLAHVFSPWRYLNVSRAEFLDDCATVNQLITGAAVTPAFITQPASRLSGQPTT